MDAIDIFLESLLMERDNIVDLLKENVPMNLTPDQEEACRTATTCYVCEGLLTSKDPGVRDHCHFTGINYLFKYYLKSNRCIFYLGHFRGVAHNSCNLKLRVGKFTPVFMHNLSR